MLENRFEIKRNVPRSENPLASSLVFAASLNHRHSPTPPNAKVLPLFLYVLGELGSQIYSPSRERLLGTTSSRIPLQFKCRISPQLPRLSRCSSHVLCLNLWPFPKSVVGLEWQPSMGPFHKPRQFTKADGQHTDKTRSASEHTLLTHKHTRTWAGSRAHAHRPTIILVKPWRHALLSSPESDMIFHSCIMTPQTFAFIMSKLLGMAVTELQK